MKDEKLQAVFQSALRPGERLLWVGAPDRRRILWYSFQRAWTWGLLLILGLVVLMPVALPYASWVMPFRDFVRIGCLDPVGLSEIDQLTCALAQSTLLMILGLVLAPLAATVMITFFMTWLRTRRERYAVTDQAFLYLGGRKRRIYRFSLGAVHSVKIVRDGKHGGTLIFRGARIASDYGRQGWVRRHAPAFRLLPQVDQVLTLARRVAQQAGHDVFDTATLRQSAYAGPRKGLHREVGSFLAILLGIPLFVAGLRVGPWLPVAAWIWPVPPLLFVTILIAAIYGALFVAFYRSERGEWRAPFTLLMAALAGVFLHWLIFSPALAILLGGGPRGQPAVQLTTHPAEDRAPTWSPDGRSLAFASERSGEWDLYLLDVAAARRAPDDSAARYLINSGGRDALPAWSPRGDWIAFVSAEGDAPRRIHLVRPDGADLQTLVADIESDRALDDVQLSWSSDGRVLLYNDGGMHALWLDHTGRVADRRAWQLEIGAVPALAPNGRWLAYAAPDGIYVFDWESREATNVTPRRWSSAEIGRTYTTPAWSPSGDRLAYVHRDALFVVEIQAERGGARPIWLTRGRDPAWSPDGTHIAFAGKAEGVWNLYLISAAPAPRWPLRVQQALGLLMVGGALIALWRARSARKAARVNGA
ncbi:MAG: TolB family protein [Anaerolineales bacterium]